VTYWAHLRRRGLALDPTATLVLLLLAGSTARVHGGLLEPASVETVTRPTVALTVDAPASLAAVAERVRQTDGRQLATALARAGLRVPLQVRITLVPEDAPRARATPAWVVGFASGTQEIVIFPGRPGAYPHDSLEAVVWHEVTHLALAAQAGDARLPRWFHEGVAMSVEKGWGVRDQAQLVLASAGRPDLADLARLFDANTRADSTVAYQVAAALVSDLRHRHGATAPGAIVDRAAQGAPFAEAFARETGELPEAAAARVWQVYRRWTSWLPVVASPSSTWVVIMALALLAFLARLRTRRRRRRQWEEEDRVATMDEARDGESSDESPTIH